MFLPFFPPLLVHLSDEEGWDPSRYIDIRRIGIWLKLGYPYPLQSTGYSLPWLHHIGVTESDR